MSLLSSTLSAIRPLDADAADAARERHDSLVKPRGSLGALEDVGARLSGLAARCPPPLPEPAGLTVFAADHGVHAQGVSPWPQEITAAMSGAFATGRATVNALARQHGIQVRVVDVGMAGPPPVPGVLDRVIRRGTDDLSTSAAMTREEAVRAIEIGIEIAGELIGQGCRCLLPGDMGIANSTPSAALIAAFTGRPAEDVTGRGTGIDDETLRYKASIVRRALDLHLPGSSDRAGASDRPEREDPSRGVAESEIADPIKVLAALGGFEHAATVGYLLGAAAARVPVVLDGVLSAAAALVAHALAPAAVDAMIAGHLSVEPGARHALSRLGLRPLLDADLRLGEGSGAVLAYPTVVSAARVLREVATLDELSAAPAPVGRKVLVLGGARSGKSAIAERMAEVDRPGGAGSIPTVTYAATGPAPDPADPEWVERVRLHRQRRPAHWRTVETRDLPPLLTADDDPGPVVIDCLGTWLAGEMDDAGFWAQAEGTSAAPPRIDAAADARLDAAVDGLVAAWTASTRAVVAISNEVGSGVVPATLSGRVFRDRLGVLNSRIAAVSDEVWLVTAGIAQRLR